MTKRRKIAIAVAAVAMAGLLAECRLASLSGLGGLVPATDTVNVSAR